MLLSTLVMALREIRRNTMRSVLTMLGIVIGVAAVIVMVIIGDGATQNVTNQISALGENMLIVSPGADRHRGGGGPGVASSFEESDVKAIETQVSGIRAMAPTSQKSVIAVFGNTNARTTVIGSTEKYFDVRSYTLDQGRMLDHADITGARSACVVGATVRKNLYGNENPVGTQLRLGKITCEVVGLLAAKGTSGMGMDQDDLVVMPLKAFQRRLAGSRDISSIYVSVDKDRPTSLVKQRIESLLRERRHVELGSDDDFNVRDMAEIAQAVTATTGAMTALLGAIAAVSLLVGGIGIMNIMLVSVTERTREIGIRLAIGALGSEVLLQFLIEAVVLSTLGGLIGIGIGLGGGFAATNAMGMPYVVTPGIVILAFAFSAFVGIAFGFLPARKAARLSPIEALRHE
ncbi:MAG: ABC transporter permease [Polyangiaceae bacterium]|nr:ABC transporter permease [Polyangiaceae bacterium]